MKNEYTSVEPSANFTRREALLNALKGAITAAVAAPVIVQAAPTAPQPEPEYVPENDYPYFGYKPEEADPP